MLSKTSAVAAVLFAQSALAFPSLAHLDRLAKVQVDQTVAARSAPASELHQADIEKAIRAVQSSSGNNVPDPSLALGFDAAKQYVSNQGDHAYQKPGPTDARGPCPGLNAMANHNYIPRNGVANLQQFIDGTYNVFGMGKDLGGFLSILGGVLDGPLLKWSIGGLSAAAPGGTGLTGSHNKYESDVSPTRPDLYQYGNDWKVRGEQWQDLYDTQAGVSDADANYNLKVLQDFRSKRFDESVNGNPYFFNGPFSGVAVQPAAYTFIYRFMGNKSAEHPDGVLNRETLKAFFGMTENADGSFSGGAGYEYIPDNWYKRAIGAEYTIPFFILDLIQEATVYPKFINIGGNTGKPNTFTGVDIEDLTGGVFNAKTLLEGNNLFCFAFQFVQQGEPDLLTSLLTTLTGDAGRAILSLGCPSLFKINEDQLEQYPGYTRSKNGEVGV